MEDTTENILTDTKPSSQDIEKDEKKKKKERKLIPFYIKDLELSLTKQTLVW